MNDRILGIFGGIALLILFAYGLWVCLGPLLAEREDHFVRALRWLLVITAVKFAVLPFVFGNVYDVMCWNQWAIGIAKAGPASIYSAKLFDPLFQCNYPPGYLYVLWPAGAIAQALGLKAYNAVRLLTESPPILADFGLGLVVFAALRRLVSPNLALKGTILFALNAALLFDSLFWGQNDSVLALALLLSTLLVADSSYAIGWAIAAIAILIKPQGLFIIPVLGWWTLLEGNPSDWCRSALAFALTFAIGFAPFQIGHPWGWALHVYSLSVGLFRMTSVNAFNLLGLVCGLRQPDSELILGVPAFALGMSLFVAIYPLVAWMLWRKRDLRALLLAIFLVYLGMFVLAPRIHERYLYPALVLAIALMFDSSATYAISRILTVTLLINLAYSQLANLRMVTLRPHDPLAGAVAIVNLGALAVAVAYVLYVASPEFADRMFPAALRSFFSAAQYEVPSGSVTG